MAKYYVSEGKALTTKKGLKDSGSELTAEMVEGGEEKLKKLVEAGLVTDKVAKKEEVKEEKKTSGAKKK